MKRETYVKRLITSYKNLSEKEKETFRSSLGLVQLKTSPLNNKDTFKTSKAPEC